MKKKKFTLRTVTDIKVFLLFLLEYIRYPVDRTTLINIVSENTDEIIIDYDECLGELSDSGHVWFDEVDGEAYYMISDSGRMVAKELFDALDEDFREKSLKSAMKHLSLAKSGATTKTAVTEVEGSRYKVTLSLQDTSGQLLEASLVVSSLSEAEKIRQNFETRPEAVYRGILFSATGRLEYIS
ncbi:MAG: DUF4364 family protein [Clostridia bacterium]|nr:DUF4364 family protein [Clostridia bacterium]